MQKNMSMWRWYRSMLRIRRIEESLADRYAEQQMRCPMHLCIGQEAIAVGVCEALKLTDMVYSNHRAHGHYLAKGGNLKALVSEIYGRSTGCCGGRGGSMHLIDLDVNFMGSTPIVGGTVPLAVGAAWAASLKGSQHVTVVFFGDGCFEEGVMHESMNFAALHKLPIVFVCENNKYSVYTELKERQPERPIYKVAESHGLNANQGDGNDVEQVFTLSSAAVENARKGLGPQFLEFSTYRWREHCGPNFDDDLGYRSSEEVSAGKASCPLVVSSSSAARRGINLQQQIIEYESELAAEIIDAFNFALSSPTPSPNEAGDKVYA